MALLAAAFSLAGALHAGDRGARTEILGSVRANSRTATAAFRIEPRQAHVSEIRIRSGSLSVLIEAIEIEFADGSTQRALAMEDLAPGRQSRPVAVDPRRTVRRIFTAMRPGSRDGETVLQVIGIVEQAPARETIPR